MGGRNVSKTLLSADEDEGGVEIEEEEDAGDGE
jgi:hypothetical protein